jgi:hypothetical protein
MAASSKTSAPEPTTLRGAICFEEADFHSLAGQMAKDTEGNARRLEARRKLLSLGKQSIKQIAALEDEPLKLECRSSLHNPNKFNGMRVNRLWTYLVRSKGDKRKLKGVLGSDLGKDLDAAYRNLYLCMAMESDALEVSMRIHSDAWFDGTNLKKKLAKEGLGGWLAELNKLNGFMLRMDDWKGEWRCGSLTEERLEEFLSYYTPGEHRLTVEQRLPAPAGTRGAALDPETCVHMQAELLRLVPLFHYCAWSPDNDHLFG